MMLKSSVDSIFNIICVCDSCGKETIMPINGFYDNLRKNGWIAVLDKNGWKHYHSHDCFSVGMEVCFFRPDMKPCIGILDDNYKMVDILDELYAKLQCSTRISRIHIKEVLDSIFKKLGRSINLKSYRLNRDKYREHRAIL